MSGAKIIAGLKEAVEHAKASAGRCLTVCPEWCSRKMPHDHDAPLTEHEIGEIVYEVFYGGPLAGSKERIAAAIWNRVQEDRLHRSK